MSEYVTELKTVDEFREIIKTGTVLVDFFATWCGPCRMQLPILNTVGEAMADKVRIVKVDTDVLKELAVEYEVSSIPTLVLLRDGKVVDRFVGLQQAETLKTAIAAAG